jgi:hypothetical protein
MIIDKLYHRSVFYIVREFVDDKSGETFREPIGTAFCVKQFVDQISVEHYVVTAAHVIRDDEDEVGNKEFFLRINGRSGLEDIPTRSEDWTCHPDTDIAVCLAPAILSEYFAHGIYDVAFGEAGQSVFFIGLFSEVPGKHSVDALVRFGRICRERSLVPITVSGEIKEVEAFLVESQPWPGASVSGRLKSSFSELGPR